MEYIDLLKILEGDIKRINFVNVKDVALYEVEVIIEPHHVRNMLLKYLSGDISSYDLTRWAMFICLRAEYYHPGDFDDDDFYEDMFYVIQCLSTPEIDGEVNEESVRRYLKELEKYKNN